MNTFQCSRLEKNLEYPSPESKHILKPKETGCPTASHRKKELALRRRFPFLLMVADSRANVYADARVNIEVHDLLDG